MPLDGALPPFLNPESVVCVSHADLSPLELRDALLRQFAGFHGVLPLVNLVQRLVTRHLRPDFGGHVWGSRVPGVKTWTPPIEELPEHDSWGKHVG